MKVCLTERREGRKRVLTKNREWNYLHGETSLKENGSWTLLEVTVRGQIFLFAISWKREQALRQGSEFVLWVLIGSFNERQASGRYRAVCPARMCPSRAGHRAPVCAVSISRPWVPTLLLTASFGISDGEKAKATAILHLHLGTAWRRRLL